MGVRRVVNGLDMRFGLTIMLQERLEGAWHDIETSHKARQIALASLT